MGECTCNRCGWVQSVDSSIDDENFKIKIKTIESPLIHQRRQTEALEKIADLLEKFYYRTDPTKKPVSYK